MEYRTTRNSQQVSIEPVMIFSVTLKAGSGGAAELGVNDGEANQAPRIVTLTAPVGESKVYNYQGGLSLGQGLYLEHLVNVERATVTYRFTGQE